MLVQFSENRHAPSRRNIREARMNSAGAFMRGIDRRGCSETENLIRRAKTGEAIEHEQGMTIVSSCYP